MNYFKVRHKSRGPFDGLWAWSVPTILVQKLFAAEGQLRIHIG